MAKMRPEQEGPQGSQLSSAGRLRAGEAVCARACMIGVVFLVILFLDCWLLCGGEFGRSRAWRRSGGSLGNGWGKVGPSCLFKVCFSEALMSGDPLTLERPPSQGQTVSREHE